MQLSIICQCYHLFGNICTRLKLLFLSIESSAIRYNYSPSVMSLCLCKMHAQAVQVCALVAEMASPLHSLIALLQSGSAAASARVPSSPKRAFSMRVIDLRPRVERTLLASRSKGSQLQKGALSCEGCVRSQPRSSSSALHRAFFTARST